MIENVMNGRTNAVTILGVNLLFRLLKTQLFITKTASQLISGKIRILKVAFQRRTKSGPQRSLPYVG